MVSSNTCNMLSYYVLYSFFKYRVSHYSIPNFTVVIIDPGINNAQGYKPYQDGIDQDIYIKVSAGSNLLSHFTSWQVANECGAHQSLQA